MSKKAYLAAGGFIFVICGYILLCLGLVVGSIWAAIHFVRKFW